MLLIKSDNEINKNQKQNPPKIDFENQVNIDQLDWAHKLTFRDIEEEQTWTIYNHTNLSDKDEDPTSILNESGTSEIED